MRPEPGLCQWRWKAEKRQGLQDPESNKKSKKVFTDSSNQIDFSRALSM